MELKKELLDEANEKLLNKLDYVFGCEGSKEVLRNIIRYNKIVQTMKCDILFENYNIILRNESSYNSYEELIEIISEIYLKNNIISKKGVYYAKREDLNPRKKEKNKIKEGIIVIDLSEIGHFESENRKEVASLINKMPDRAFIIIEDNYRGEGFINANFNELFTWSMKIEKISFEEKTRYAINFMKKNKIKCSEKIAENISDVPFYQLKSNLINLMITCKSKNIKNLSDLLDVPRKKEKKKSGRVELEELIGIEEVKEQVNKIINYIKISKNRENMPMLHMCFTGNPGTGKTTVARIVGKIFKEEEILTSGNFVEAQRADLVGEYIGHTAPKTQKIVKKADGGILFIDEAYNLDPGDSSKDYGHECIATLIKEMEDKRDNLCVILAGYTKEMDNLIKANPGFKSRIQFTINFPDYSEEELYEIFKNLCKKEKYKISPNVKELLIKHFEIAKKEENFSNGRYVRNLFEKIKMEQASRVVDKKENQDLIKKVDIENILSKENKLKKEKIKIGFAK